MFGFVNVYKDELKIKDYNVFKSYYCGLCKSLGENYNQSVRLGLSYDLTFLAILADSLNDDEIVLKKEGCIKHLGSKRLFAKNKSVDYAADMSILLSYWKLCDDIKDEKSVKAFIMRIPYMRPFKRASKRHVLVSESIKTNLDKLSFLESQKCSSIDEVSDPFASLTSDIFSMFNNDLKEIGYDIGRFIYIADAYKDIEYDKKHNSYNPFLNLDEKYLNGMEFKKRVMGTFNMNLKAISDSYKKLNIYKNKEILDNIIYLGLTSVFNKLFFDNGGKK